jgi:hypothetical protein
MTTLQIQSVEPGFESPPVLHPLIGLASRAVAMGLLPGGTIKRLDSYSIRQLLEALQSAGLLGAQRARLAALLQPQSLLRGKDKEAAALLERLIEVVEESPSPATEWPAMRQTFGDEALADLLVISLSSLKRYAGGERSTPAEIADRLHWLAMVVADLAGSYNEFGIQRWFARARRQLDGRSPRKMLGARWQSDDASAQRVRALAASLTAAGAT